MRCLMIVLALLIVAPETTNAYPASSLASIQVVAPPNPTHITLKDGDAVTAIALGVLFGPGATAGDLVGSAKESGRDPSLSQKMAEQNLRIGDELAQAMESALKQRGYNASVAAVPQSPTTRIVFIIEEAGYERRVWGKVGPKLTVRVRLLDAVSGSNLWRDTYKYDLVAMTIGWTMLRPPEQYGFKEPGDVLAQPGLAVEGLRTGIRMIADRAASDMLEDVDK